MKTNHLSLLFVALLGLSSCGGGEPSSSSSSSSSSEPPKVRSFTTFGHEIVDREMEPGVHFRLLRTISSSSTNHRKAISESEDSLSATFAGGDEIEITSDSAYLLFDGFGFNDVLLYSPSGIYRIEIPEGKNLQSVNSSAFVGTHSIEARIPTERELSDLRNIALNPFDVLAIEEAGSGSVTQILAEDSPYIKHQAMFPHAYASVTTRNESTFFARNAIDGNENTAGHGNYPYESWGYDQKEEAVFTLYFGRKVSLSSLGIFLRHDTANNHDTYWESAVIEYEGGEMEAEFENLGTEQTVEFEQDIETSFIRIRDIVSANTGQGYAALTEIKAYGSEIEATSRQAKAKGVQGNFALDYGPAYTTRAFRADDILDNMERANRWFIDATDKGTLKVPMYDLNSTEQVKLGDIEWKDSVYYSGLTDYAMTTGNMEAYDYIKGLSETYSYRCNGGTYTPHGDHYQVGETYMQLGDIAGVSYPSKQPRDNLDWNIAAYPNVPPKVSGDHRDDNSRDWTHLSFWWCDALYMALNSYTLQSLETGDAKYVETAKEAYDYAKAALYDKEDHLWHRDSTQLSLTNSQDSGEKHKVYWARGNAWVFAALAKQLIYLDQDQYPEIYDAYKEDYIEMAEALANHQRDDGLWNVSITPYKAYEGKEITGTCGFLYGYCVGIALGVLDGAEYFPMVQDGFDTVFNDCWINDTDQLGYMQTVGYQPQNYVSEAFSSKITNEFGMGLFLMASSALLRLTEDYEPGILPMDAGRQSYFYK